VQHVVARPNNTCARVWGRGERLLAFPVVTREYGSVDITKTVRVRTISRTNAVDGKTEAAAAAADTDR